MVHKKGHNGKDEKMKHSKSKMKQKSGKAKATAKRSKAGAGSWINHVKQVAKTKGISYKEALKVASKSYKKK
jgi:hypothetical protein